MTRWTDYPPDVQRAWELYCRETAGDMDARDFWHELSPPVRELYLQRVRDENRDDQT